MININNKFTVISSKYYRDASNQLFFEFIINRNPSDSPIGDMKKIIKITTDNVYEFTYTHENINYKIIGKPYIITDTIIFIECNKSNKIENNKKVLSINKIEFVRGELSDLSNGSYDDEDDDLFASDMIFTKEFGKFVPGDSGSVVIPSKNKTIKEILLEAYSEELQPVITKPSITINAPQCKSYEVGTSVVPTYSIMFNKGSYSYGPDTGVVPITYNVGFNSEAKTTSNGDFSPITVTDDTNLKITANVNYSDSISFAKTNLQNITSLKIMAGIANATSNAITGYRNTFYGTVESKDPVTSDIIRGLSGKSNGALKNGATFNIPIPVGALRIIIAYPATLKDLTNVLDVNGLNASIKGSFNMTTLSVEGANGSAGIEYKIYILDYAEPNKTRNTYKVTI